MWWWVALAALVVLFPLYKRWVRGGVCRAKADLTDKVVIVTGANTGIGFETAKALAGMGAHVILACRNEKLGEAAVKRIEKANKSASVECQQLDLASLASIRAFAQKFLKRNMPLHLLVLNAGVMFTPKETTKDGFELQFGTNHLGHFLLTNLLLDKLKESAPSRIVSVSSLASTAPLAKIYFQDINSVQSYNRYAAYCQSKLANVLFVHELARRLKEEGYNGKDKPVVSAFSLHPGTIVTELSRHMIQPIPFLLRQPWFTYFLPLKTAFEGAQTSLYCCIAPELEDGKRSGQYFSDCAPVKHPKVDDATAKKLWQLSEDMVKDKGL
ncbi:retinol dehydrogenase 12 (all-trans 9-cis 11-cis) [Balamuthia mandrillaris]